MEPLETTHKKLQIASLPYLTFFTTSLKILFLIISLLLLLLINGCEKQQQDEKNNLENGIVKIQLGQYKFDVPVRYMYGKSKEKWNIWRHPKQGRTTVDYLHLSMLLPDLQPYYVKDDARWKVLGHGDRLEVNINRSDRPGDVKSTWFNFAVEDIRNDSRQNKFYIKCGDQYGLNHFSGTDKESDTYFPSQNIELMIDCYHPSDAPSPGCHVKSNYRKGLILEYTYASSYLPNWHEIDTKLKNVFNALQTK